jgi:DNA-binding CsgD family transcriptional regulator
MLYDGRHTEARNQLETARVALVERGDEGDLGHLLLWLSWLELRCGRLLEAEQIADDAIASAEITGNASMRRFAAVQRAYTLAQRGELDEARRICTAEAAFLDERSVAQIGLWITSTLTFIDLSIGEAEAAWRHCEALVGAVEGMESYEPVVLMFLPDALESLVALGQLARAESLLDTFERRGGELDRVWAIATGARCRGLLLAARGDHAGALAALERALAEHARIEMPFERARTLLVRGMLERRARQRTRARVSLEEASAEFARVGARVWARRAREECARLGGSRTTAHNELTRTERRVAELAAAGHSNKEIAAILFVSVSTVEKHLSHAYAKLGVRSRGQLTRRLAAPA